MTLNDLFPSKYLAKEDVPTPTVATVQQVTQVEMNDNGVKVMKPILVLSAFRKPLVLNKLNAQSVAAVYGSDTSAWVGKPIEVFVDPNVMMQGRMVGGLRLRAPSQFAAAPQPARPVAAPNVFTTAVAQSGQQLWNYSDGLNATPRQTTQQVIAFLQEMLDQGVDLNTIKIRASGTSDPAELAPAWLARQESAPAAAHDDIPF